MIGSYILPDSIEVAMALELIQKNISKKVPTVLKNKLWSNKQTNFLREYYPKYRIVGELAEALRWAEQRQGIARTRYLYHDVDFYILSKDRVDKYERFAQITEDQYRSDLFGKKPENPNSLYHKVKNAALKYLSEHDILKVGDILPITKDDGNSASRQTVSDHLCKMVKNGILIREHGGKKYKLSSSSEDENLGKESPG